MAGHAAPFPSVSTKKAARKKTGNQPSRCRAVPDMEQTRGNYRAGRQGDGTPEGPVISSLATRFPLAMPNDDDHISALADMSSAQAVDRSMPSIRDWSVVRVSVRTSEHPVDLARWCRCLAR